MPDLTSDQQEMIVVRLACYASATEIIAEFVADGQKAPSLAQIGYYDPTTAAGSRKLKQDWKDLFWTTRAEHDADILARVPITNRSYRLMRYDRIVADPLLGKSKLGLKALEQAAKDLGGLYERVADPKGDETEDTLPAEMHQAVDKVYGDKEPGGESRQDDVSPQPRL